jgi:hypothetical protein
MLLDYEENVLSFFSASNSSCNNATEDCATDPTNGTAICSCKLGYAMNSTTQNCTGMISQELRFIIEKSIYFCLQISTNVC